jgi:V-type H+-transporting ATPase subunit d
MRNTRQKLYPSIGYLYPAGTARLADVTDESNIEQALGAVPEYQKLYASISVSSSWSATHQSLSVL